MKKKYYRSQKDRKITGVCGGLSEYFGFDSTFVRLGFILLALLAGFGIFLYIVLSIITPNDMGYTPYKEVTDKAESKKESK